MNPTPTQALLLFGLLARHGACSQAELIPAVKKADREALALAKLIAVGKVGRGLGLTLADNGWAWTAAHLDAELPPAQRALSDMLLRLDEHLRRSGGTLADVIGAKPRDAAEFAAEERQRRLAEEKAAKEQARARRAEEERRERAKKTAKAAKARQAEGNKRRASQQRAAAAKGVRPTNSKPPAASHRTPTSQAAIRQRIEEAYLALTGNRKGEMVRLALLRAELADLNRATVDAALKRILQGDKKASLMRNDDPRQLGPADHEAAFNPSGEPFHILWIAS